ncbi:MAG TPA: hypothetical protein VFO61_05710 [Alphaproteobacteria bacterium]|nr:hypothetical protein [Alphaproteobacteria bacterium]
MQKNERDILIEMIGAMQSQAVMFHALLEVLTERGFLTEIEETELFNAAESRLVRMPEGEARAYAAKVLRQWRRDGLVQAPRRKRKAEGGRG